MIQWPDRRKMWKAKNEVYHIKCESVKNSGDQIEEKMQKQKPEFKKNINWTASWRAVAG